ncbi:MAG: lysophospholipid acyltransferase family protein [Candidatus Fimenecus sp.]
MKNTVVKHLKRNKFMIAFTRFIAKRAVAKSRNFKFEKYTPKNQPFLMISNHTTPDDPVLLGLAFTEYFRYVCAAHLLETKFLGKLFKFCADPIPRVRGGDSKKTVDDIINTLKSGVNVSIYAEGLTTIDGQTEYISDKTGELVKNSGASLLLVRFIGGYMQRPRWSKYRRKGPITFEVTGDYSAEEISRMSVTEVNSVIRKGLYLNAYERQRETPVKYKGKCLAENLETVLWLCPNCNSIGKTESCGNEFYCKECGMKLIVNEYGFFEGENLKFDNVLDWNNYQKKYLNNNVEKLKTFIDEPIVSFGGQTVDKHENGNIKRIMNSAKLDIYGDRLELISENGDSLNFKLDDIKKMGVGARTRLGFTTRDGIYYNINSRVMRSSLVYFGLWRVLTGKKYL